MSEFKAEDIKEAELALSHSQNTQAVPFNPISEVEHSLVNLVKHRIKKLQDDVDYEEQLKSAILARLPEATFAELMQALAMQQGTSNTSLEKILAPFIPKMGDRVPLLDNKEVKNEDNFASLNKDDLQALNELRKAITIIKEKEPESDTIKNILFSSDS